LTGQALCAPTSTPVAPMVAQTRAVAT
jgi:hypothetical protein